MDLRSQSEFLGFSFGFAYPRRGSREDSNLEVPRGTERNSPPQEKAVFHSQRRRIGVASQDRKGFDNNSSAPAKHQRKN